MSFDKVMEELEEKRLYLEKRLQEEPLPYRRDAEISLKKEIEELGLQSHVVNLEIDGYTILSPEELQSQELVERLLAGIETASQRKTKTSLSELEGIGGALMHLVREDPVFEEVLLQPKPTALLTYLLGYHAKLSQCTALLKPKSEDGLMLHADSGGKFPHPWPETAQDANVTWILTDYTEDAGPLYVFPGSHRLGNPPLDNPLDYKHPDAVPIIAPAGSCVVWHGGLWHGGMPRQIDGLRKTLVLYYNRQYMEVQEAYKYTTTMEMLERNPARFGVMMGVSDWIPWTSEGPTKQDFTVVSGINRYD